MFAIATVLLAFLAVCNAHLNTQPDVLAALKLGNFNIPKQWSAFKIAGKSGSVPTGYFEVTTYGSSTSCSGSATAVSGIGLGSCMVSGTTSMAYDWGKTAKSYSMKLYSTPDCTGTATTYDMPLPPCTASGAASYKYAMVNGTTPWTSYDKGIVSEMFTSADDCHQGGSGAVYSWSPLNVCTATQDCDGTKASFLYSKCSGGSVSQTEYSDTACGVQTSTNSRTLSACVDTSSDQCGGEPSPYPFFTQVCQE